MRVQGTARVAVLDRLGVRRRRGSVAGAGVRAALLLGVGITQLVRAWVLERLDEPEPSAAVGDLMEALERSLRAARTIKRASGTQKQAG